MDKYEWLFYVGLAGLAWGTYVPIIFYGGLELGGKPNDRLMAVLCVGVAYFVIGVLLPLVAFLSGWQAWPVVNSDGPDLLRDWRRGRGRRLVGAHLP